MKHFYKLYKTIAVIVLFFTSPCFAQNKVALGWVEKVKIIDADIILSAKLDTGAENSSLHAEKLVEFTRDNKAWARFEISDNKGKTATIESPIIARARIKSIKSKIVKRPVIRLGICLGSEYMEAEVNLFDRSSYDYGMLIGRSFLAGNVLVDSAIMFSKEPNCSAKKAAQTGSNS